jgi:hypothetical protein
MKMTETKVGYQAVFYSGDKRIDVSEIKNTHEEAEKSIEKKNEDYQVFKYTPWTHTVIEEVRKEDENGKD